MVSTGEQKGRENESRNRRNQDFTSDRRRRLAAPEGSGGISPSQRGVLASPCQLGVGYCLRHDYTISATIITVWTFSNIVSLL